LHFGLLSLAAEGERWPDREGQTAMPARRFGGVGLMVRRPGIELSAERWDSWEAQGALAKRALDFARRVAEALVREKPEAVGPPLRLSVRLSAPEHAGLGTGTQLGLAVTKIVTAAWGIEATVEDLARWSGRGLRSALGVYGFDRGGLLVEAGKGSTQHLAPLAARLDFPEDWRVVLVVPARGGPGAEGLHGPEESAAFALRKPQEADLARTNALCRLALLGLIPAAVEHDLEAFGEALYDFNRRSGEMFAAIQSGLYAGAAVADVVAYIRSQGIRGVGQSSWGPTVFAVVGDEDRAEDLAQRLGCRLDPDQAQVLISEACNSGAASSSTS
jgi:beta-RFAP synthase